MQQFNLGSPVSACAPSSLSGLLLEARIAPDSQKLVTAFQRIEFKPVADVAYRVIAALECPLRVDAVDKVSDEQRAGNKSNPGAAFFESMLRARLLS
jgi:hypothetical protein